MTQRRIAFKQSFVLHPTFSWEDRLQIGAEPSLVIFGSDCYDECK